MTLNIAKTEEKDPILENKDILQPGKILDHNTLDLLITDSNPMIEIVTAKHIKLHIKTETTVDLVAIPTPEAPAEIDPIQRTEKEPIHSTEIGHLQKVNKILPCQTKTVDTEKCT